MKVAWISYFPVEWLPDLPPPLRHLPRSHPASWQRVLMHEMRQVPDLKLHIFALQKFYPRDFCFEHEGVTIHLVKASLKLRLASVFWWDALLLRKRLRAVQPDLVHAWGSERGAALAASRLPYPYLVTVQGLLQWYASQVNLNWFTHYEAQLEAPGLRRASVVTTESSFGVNWLRNRYPHLEIVQAEHAPDWIFHRIQREPQERPLRFLFIGALSMLKGTDVLFQALDQLRSELDFELIAVGPCTESFLRELKRRTSADLWSRVTLRQEGLTPEQIAGELVRATMMIFPTRADTSPNSVKEAVVAGVPVVASQVGGIVDYVVPGANGLLVPPGDFPQLVGAIRSAVGDPRFGRGSVDPDTLLRMRRYLSPSAMCGKFLGAYERVTQRSRLPKPGVIR